MRSIYTLPAISVKLSPDRPRPNGQTAEAWVRGIKNVDPSNFRCLQVDSVSNGQTTSDSLHTC